MYVTHSLERHSVPLAALGQKPRDTLRYERVQVEHFATRCLSIQVLRHRKVHRVQLEYSMYAACSTLTQ